MMIKNLLQKIQKITHGHALTNGQKMKEQYDKIALPHTFKNGDKVLIENDFHSKIIDINDTNTKVKLKNKIKVQNVSRLKHFFKKVENSEDEEDASKFFNQNNDQAQDFSDIFNQAHHHGPITRA
jgi:hypothetical protein